MLNPQDSPAPHPSPPTPTPNPRRHLKAPMSITNQPSTHLFGHGVLPGARQVAGDRLQQGALLLHLQLAPLLAQCRLWGWGWGWGWGFGIQVRVGAGGDGGSGFGDFGVKKGLFRGKGVEDQQGWVGGWRLRVVVFTK